MARLRSLGNGGVLDAICLKTRNRHLTLAGVERIWSHGLPRVYRHTLAGRHVASTAIFHENVHILASFYVMPDLALLVHTLARRRVVSAGKSLGPESVSIQCTKVVGAVRRSVVIQCRAESIPVRGNAMKAYAADAKYELMVAAIVVRLRKPPCAATRMTTRLAKEYMLEITDRSPRRPGSESLRVQTLATDLLTVASIVARSHVTLRPASQLIVQGRPT